MFLKFIIVFYLYLPHLANRQIITYNNHILNYHILIAKYGESFRNMQYNCVWEIVYA